MPANPNISQIAIKVIKSEKLSSQWEPRFVIVDETTGNVLDDAQGYGYTSAQNAHRAWSWKSKSKSEKKRISRRHKAIAKWWDRHPEFELEVEDIMLHGAVTRPMKK